MKKAIIIREWSKNICHGGLLAISMGVGGSVSAQAAAQVSEDELFAFASQVAQYVISQEYGILSRLHHLPVSTANNRSVANESRCQLEQHMREIATEFGELKQLSPLRDPAIFMGLASRSGNEAYWQNRPGAYTFTYAAQYKNAGDGILKLEVVDIKGRPELKAINFGFYASEEALATLQRMAATVAEFHHQLDANHACHFLLNS